MPAAKRIAFVPPWYGTDILGGAEQVCRTTAERLAAAGLPVEVLTTTAKDLFTGWNTDYHRPGTTMENGVPVTRFPLDRAPITTFGALNERLIAGRRLTPAEEIAYFRQSVNSEALYRAIREREQTVFIFIPYPFGTTYFGAQIAPASTYLLPALHDEGYARMRCWTPVFRAVRGVIALTKPERDLIQRLYGVPDDTLLLWGAGVDTSPVGNPDRFRHRFGIDGPFLFAVGRRDRTKNTPLLIEYVVRYLLRRPDGPALVLAGSGAVAIPRRFRSKIIDIGRISEQEKADGCAAALALVQPSVNESFSFVLMESWLQRRPVLVNAESAVMAQHCRESGGGLPFRGFAEFAGCLDWLLEHPAEADRMGEAGRRYVLANYDWRILIDRYARLLG
ncbi:MAG: glycosyltransferase family 4 protein [Chloroflexota bacterium]|nr:glycosyltransferase family 4 protein [Dehalococcoidia bacterium]MDW8252386.1 glycosyltransferase family 4 protein [Chloroflexota bacterium]